MPRPGLALSLQFADRSHRALLPRHRVARWLRAALAGPAEIAVRVVGEAEARELNRRYRYRDYATDVLTFDYAREPVIVADLILCAAVVERDAGALGVGVEARYARLLVHGALHAQGHDHQDARQARAMERREDTILRALGFEPLPKTSLSGR